MIDRKTLGDRMWAIIDTEENSDSHWHDDVDALFDCMFSVCSSAAKYNVISEAEMVAYLDYKKEQLRRRVFGKAPKQKDFGDKRGLK